MEKLNFLIQSEKKDAFIYVRFRNGRKFDIKAKTPLTVNPSYWDKKQGNVTEIKTAKNKAIFNKLDDLEKEIWKRYKERDKDTVINSEWLKDAVNGVNKDTKHIPERLADYYDYYRNLKRGRIGYTTEQKLKVQKKVIIDYEIHDKQKPVLIKNVSPDFINKFETFCMDLQFSQNTIAQIVKSIKTICLHARKKIQTHKELDDITYTFSPSKVIYLNPQELRTLKNTKFNNETLDVARDWLLISCETGQRVSDFMRFRKNMISTVKGVSMISFVQKKTRQRMEIALTDNVLSILKKRNGEFPPPLSEQYYNDRIKMVCDYAGINELIENATIKQKVEVGEKKDKNGKLVPIYKQRNIVGTYPKYKLICSHTGRRSMASNYYGKLPLADILEMTGHSTEKQLLAYIGKAGKSEKAVEIGKKLKKINLY